MGIRFNTQELEWSLQEEKADDLIRKFLWAAKADSMSLKQTQQLLGSLNDLSQMCPFMKPFRALANSFLASFDADEISFSACVARQEKTSWCAPE